MNEKHELKPKLVLLKAEEVACMLAISTRTLWRLVSVHKFPAPIRVGSSTRWRATDVEAWVHAGCPTAEEH